MAGRDLAVIVDLATDSSSPTVSQVIAAVEKKVQPDHRQQQQQQQPSKVNGHTSSPFVVVALTSKNAEPIELDSLPFPVSQVISSDNQVGNLFHAKSFIDTTPGIGCDVLLITSVMMKKFWEAACFHLFSPLTSWSVFGLDIEGQSESLQPQATTVEDLEVMVKDFLKTVGNPAEVKLLRCDRIPEYQFNAGYHERYGGISQVGTMASMNMVFTLRKTDPILVIMENRRRLAEAAGFDVSNMYVTKAEHRKTIWVVGTPQPPRYDGIVTDQPGVTICAAGADCCMILLADTQTGAVGVVHSGWRGTALGAVKALIHTMTEKYKTVPADVRAAIGPSVTAANFDLSPEDAKPITDIDPSLTWPSKVMPHLVQVDLIQANVIMLQREGVLEENIDLTHALCTYENTQFFSHRRDGLPFGNQLGFISCRPPHN